VTATARSTADRRLRGRRGARAAGADDRGRARGRQRPRRPRGDGMRGRAERFSL